MGGPYKGISYYFCRRGFEVAMVETSNMTSGSRQCKAEVGASMVCGPRVLHMDQVTGLVILN